MTQNSKMKQGEQFEADVAGIYSAMGFAVSRRVPISGQEVDILAKKVVAGAGDYRVMVECKYKGGRALAGNADVQAIAGAYQIARTTHQVSACSLVTTNGFTLSAQSAAIAAGIHLVTRADLIRNLFDFSPFYRALAADFAVDFGVPGERWYIPARARSGNTQIKSLDAHVDAWRVRPHKQPLVILGGYGTGKTSFCRHYALRLLAEGSGILPIIIPLRDFQKAAKIESVIRDFLEEQCSASEPRFESFWKMYQEGMLLLLFDGFDEMASQVDAHVLETNLAEIERFARSPGNMILTCRPEVFVSAIEETHALEPSRDALSTRKAGYERVELELWNDDEVATFVRNRVKAAKNEGAKNPEFYLERIANMPALKDMSTRAVHLELIVKILPEMVAEGRAMSRSNLYRTYIEREFRRENVQNRRLRLISDTERVALLEEIASRSFLKGQRALDFETAVALVREVLNPPRSEVDAITRDLLNRSFLRRWRDTYLFAHKSLGEYLHARSIHGRLEAGDTSFLQDGWDSAAVAGLVLELFGGPAGFWQMAFGFGLVRDQEIEERDFPAVRFVSAGMYDYTTLVPRKEYKEAVGIFEMLSTIDRKVVKSVNVMWPLFAKMVDRVAKLEGPTTP